MGKCKISITIDLTNSEGEVESHPIEVEAVLPEEGTKLIDNVEKVILELNKEAIRQATSTCIMTELTEIFLWEESRKVDKTGCVSVFGNIFEVPSHLSSQTVTLRFDPYDLSVMQVWHDGNRLPDAQLLDLNRSIHERVKSRSKVEKQEDAQRRASIFSRWQKKNAAMFTNMRLLPSEFTFS